MERQRMPATAGVAAAADAAALGAAQRPGGAAQPRPDFLSAGNPRPVARALAAAARRRQGVLALVVETAGSTYAAPGAMALFEGESQVGWLSGGCLEPELARRAAQAETQGRLEWLEIDTRDDAHLFSGAALGCRGRLRIALLPLRMLPGIEVLLEAWQAGGTTLRRDVAADGTLRWEADGQDRAWSLPCDPPEWSPLPAGWRLPLSRPPEALLLGAGPETPLLLRLLRELGWRTRAVEQRPRWSMAACDADDHARTWQDAGTAAPVCDAALVMHHAFELDRDALEALAGTRIPFIGLLGPRRRRDDLFKLLSPARRAALEPRLHSPVGLDLGGQGPEAIALSIAAQLQAWRARAGQA